MGGSATAVGGATTNSLGAVKECHIGRDCHTSSLSDLIDALHSEQLAEVRKPTCLWPALLYALGELPLISTV